MIEKRTRIWYDLTMALTYPAVLGAVVFFFLDSTIRAYIVSVVRENATLFDFNSVLKAIPQLRFFDAFGVTGPMGFVGLLAITLMIGIHHSADYLYSKYSESNYEFRNFFWDTIISLLLAIAYITLTSSANGGIEQINAMFTIFWTALALTYSIFLWWDTRTYQEFLPIDRGYAQFYRRMV